jgi:hypothetical protein
MPSKTQAIESPKAASISLISVVVFLRVVLTSKKTRCAPSVCTSSARASAALRPICTRSVAVKPSVALLAENIDDLFFVVMTGEYQCDTDK